MAVDLGHIKSIQLLLSNGAKLEYSYESVSSVDQNETYISDHKVIENASNMDIVNILIEAGADIKDISISMRNKLLGLDFDIKLDLSKENYNKYKQKLLGETNPELITNPFNLYMLKTGKCAGEVANKFDDKYQPIFSSDRYGRSITILEDGRIIEIGGEHEDGYVPEFCIYNDITVFYPDKHIEIYGYPKDVFPPTDSHTATLVGDSIYIIGNLGYFEARIYDMTPVYKLSIKDYSIEEVKSKGHMPKWIHGHKASYDGINSIIISEGTILQEKDSFDNKEKFVLNLETLEWQKI